MKDNLFDIFSENTEIPPVVMDHISDAFRTIEEQDHKEYNSKTTPIQLRGRRDRRRKMSRTLLISAAALVCLGTAVFAAEKYWGISDFLKGQGRYLSEDAGDMITVVTDQEKTENELVDFTVKEALYDGDSIYIAVEAVAKEPDKYLLLPTDAIEEDLIKYYGIPSELTIEEYANQNHKELLYIGSGLDYASSPEMISYQCDFIMQEDDRMGIFISSTSWSAGQDQSVTCVNTVRDPEAKSVEDIIRSEIKFSLQDAGTAATTVYLPENSSTSGAAPVQKAVVKKTKLSTYIEVSFTDSNENLAMQILDTDQKAWDGFLGGEGIQTREDGSFVERFIYESRELPESFLMQGYNPEDGTVYWTIPMVQEN